MCCFLLGCCPRTLKPNPELCLDLSPLRLVEWSVHTAFDFEVFMVGRTPSAQARHENASQLPARLSLHIKPQYGQRSASELRPAGNKEEKENALGVLCNSDDMNKKDQDEVLQGSRELGTENPCNALPYWAAIAMILWM